MNTIFEEMASMRDDSTLPISERIKNLQRYRGWRISEVATASGVTTDDVRRARKGTLHQAASLRILRVVADPLLMRPFVEKNIKKHEVVDYLIYLSGAELDAKISDNIWPLWCNIEDVRTVQTSQIDLLAENLSYLCKSPVDDAKKIKRSLMDCMAESDTKSRRYGFMSVCSFMKQSIMNRRTVAGKGNDSGN